MEQVAEVVGEEADAAQVYIYRYTYIHIDIHIHTNIYTYIYILGLNALVFFQTTETRGGDGLL